MNTKFVHLVNSLIDDEFIQNVQDDLPHSKIDFQKIKEFESKSYQMSCGYMLDIVDGFLKQIIMPEEIKELKLSQP